MKFIEGAKKVGLALGVLEPVPEPAVKQIAQPSLPAIPQRAEAPPPIPKESAPVIETLVRPFSVRAIEHDVTLDGITYNCRVSNFSFHSDSVHGDVAIVRNGRWEVRCHAMLVWREQPNDDCQKEFIAAFANAGLMVSRKLIDACVYPLQMQVLEIKRTLHSFGV